MELEVVVVVIKQTLLSETATIIPVLLDNRTLGVVSCKMGGLEAIENIAMLETEVLLMVFMVELFNHASSLSANSALPDTEVLGGIVVWAVVRWSCGFKCRQVREMFAIFMMFLL